MSDKPHLIAITACPSGVAHTYMAAENLERAAEELGYTMDVETHGQIGIENAFSQEAINRAEAVTVVPYKSANYFKYQDALQNAVTRVFDGSEDAKTSWKTWVAEAEAFS